MNHRKLEDWAWAFLCAVVVVVCIAGVAALVVDFYIKTFAK